MTTKQSDTGSHAAPPVARDVRRWATREADSYVRRERRRAAAHGRRGRSTEELLSHFGYTVPDAPPPEAMSKESNLFDAMVSPRGPMAVGGGWSPVPAPLPVYRMTSEQTPGVWPFIAANGLPPTGAPMGLDWLSGGRFYADPIGWVQDDSLSVTAPNMIVFGKPGRGKSGTIKMFGLRMMPFGYRLFVLGDPKDEYEAICKALGVDPFAIGPGMPTRINPLDKGPLSHNWVNLTAEEAQRRATIIFARWQILLEGLVDTQGAKFRVEDGEVVGDVLRSLTGYTPGNSVLAPVTIPQVRDALAEPSDELWRDCRYASRQAFLDDTRPVCAALTTLVKGSLAGMFDEATNIAIDWRAPIQSLSLSRLDSLGDAAMGIGLLCLNSWGRGMTDIAEPADLRIVIRDEAWKQMRLGVGAVKSLDADLRFSRRDGCIQIVLAHKPSDMLSVGDAGSQAVAIAKDMLGLIDTKVLLGQDPEVGDELADLLNLAPMARETITGWAMGGKGRALWVVGDRRFKVETVRTGIEEELTYTNDNIAGGAAA